MWHAIEPLSFDAPAIGILGILATATEFILEEFAIVHAPKHGSALQLSLAMPKVIVPFAKIDSEVIGAELQVFSLVVLGAIYELFLPLSGPLVILKYSQVEAMTSTLKHFMTTKHAIVEQTL
jgi:hypothetical protein